MNIFSKKAISNDPSTGTTKGLFEKPPDEMILDACVVENSYNFAKRMMSRYGFAVGPEILMEVIVAGGASEVFNQRNERRCFDVPLCVGGEEKMVRTVVSSDFFKVFCVLPPPKVVTSNGSR